MEPERHTRLVAGSTAQHRQAVCDGGEGGEQQVTITIQWQPAVHGSVACGVEATAQRVHGPDRVSLLHSLHLNPFVALTSGRSLLLLHPLRESMGSMRSSQGSIINTQTAIEAQLTT